MTTIIYSWPHKRVNKYLLNELLRPLYLIMFLFLTGCATTLEEQGEVSSEKMEEDSGIIFGSISTEYYLYEEKIRGDETPDTKLELLYTQREKVITLKIINFLDPFSERVETKANVYTVFAKRLPVGNYTFYRAKYGGISTPISFGFKVEKNKLTYIGTFDVKMNAKKGLFGEMRTQYISIQVLNDQEKAEQIFLEKNPEIKVPINVYLAQKYTSDISNISTTQNKTYGISEQNPILLGSRTGGRFDVKVVNSYLNDLTGPKGEKIEYSRIGTCCEFKTPRGLLNGIGVLEVWALTYDGLSEPTNIFINIYDYGEVSAPAGFMLKK